MKQTEIKIGAIYRIGGGCIARVTDHYDNRVFYQHLTENTGAVYSDGIYTEDTFLKNSTLGGEDMHHLGLGTVLQKGDKEVYRKVLSVSSDGRMVSLFIYENTYKKVEEQVNYGCVYSVDELIANGYHIATPRHPQTPPDTTEQMNTEEAEKALLALGRKVKIVE